MRDLLDNNDHLQLPIKNVTCDTEHIPDDFGHLRLLCLNARDLRVKNKLSDLQHIAEENKLDIICVNETFLTENDHSFYAIPGYSHQALVREKRCGGGCSIFVHETFTITEVDRYQSTDQTVQILRCRIKRRLVDVYVLSMYANNRDKHASLLSLLDQALPNSPGTPVVLGGDSNINILNSDSISNQYLSKLASRGLLPLFEQVTRFESQSCLDHLFVSVGSPLVHITAAIIQTHIFSDHFPLMASICYDWPHDNSSTPRPPTRRRIFSKKNYTKFFNLIESLDISHTMLDNDASTALNNLMNKINTAYNIAFPIIQFIPNKKTTNTGLTEALKRERRRLDKIRKKYFSDKTNPEKKTSYYAAIRAYKHNVYLLHTSRFTELTTTTNTSKLWRKINQTLERGKKQTAVTKLCVNDTVYDDQKTIADFLCKHYARMGEHTVEHLSDNSAFAYFLEQGPVYNRFNFRPIQVSELIKIGSSIKADLNGSIDEVPSTVLKQALHILAAPLAHVFNLSVTQGKVPVSLKKAIVLPLYKGKGDRNSPDSYRPITLCSYLSKLLEKCVLKQIISHLTDIKYFSNSQNGFITGRSTDRALSGMVDFITSNCDGGDGVLAAYLDVSRAFDSVSHQLLSRLLAHIGFTTEVCDWFDSYLSDRCVRVRVGHEMSLEQCVTRGVPQGSSIGPVLFVIFINVLLKYLDMNTNLFVTCFADDLSLLYKVEKLHQSSSINRFEATLSLVKKIYDELQLALNVDKTVFVLFKSRQSRVSVPGSSISFDGIDINLSHQVKTLGLTISDHFNWLSHFTSLRPKCYSTIAALSRLRNLSVPLETLIYLYKALLLPILTYGIVVWGGTYATHFKMLEVIQNDALRAIFYLRRSESVSTIKSNYKLLSLQQLYILRVGCYMYKELMTNVNTRYVHYTFRQPPVYSFRNYHQTDVDRTTERTTFVLNSPQYQHRLIWNNIPSYIRSASTYTVFKSLLTAHIFGEITMKDDIR